MQTKGEPLNLRVRDRARPGGKIGLVAVRGLAALGTVPEHAFSRLAGFWSRRQLPDPVRLRLLQYFVDRFGVDLADVEKPLGEYRTLHEFFIRKLRPGCRPIDPRTDAVISPVDGFVAESGQIVDGQLLQAKGRGYTLRALLADDDEASALDGGSYVTLYLHPRNYHRIHSPVDGRIVACRAIPGRLLPVMPAVANNVDEVFAKNERVVTSIDSDLGPVAGDELGIFHLGSTVICVFPKGRVDLEVYPLGRPIRLGEIIGTGSRGARS